ncbi:hypothetical protein EON66_09430, partial [archaeon]
MWRPLRWKRGTFLAASIITLLVALVLLEFSYSSLFASNQFVVIVSYRVGLIFVEQILRSLLKEVLLVAPLVVLLQIMEGVMVQGALMFTDFMLAFGIRMLMVVVARLYIDPLVKIIMNAAPRGIMWARRKARRHVRMTRDQRIAEEQAWRRMQDEAALERESVEPLLESYVRYSTEALGLVMQPLLQFALLILDANPMHTFEITQIPANYGIRAIDVIFYTVFYLLMIPFQLCMDSFLLHALELLYRWKFVDYALYQRYRYTKREKRWQLASQKVDAAIREPLQTTDMMCFSSQYYFVLALHAWSMLLLLMGLQVQLKRKHNVFSDWVLLVIVLVLWPLCALIKRAAVLLSDTLGLWHRKSEEGTVEDEVAARLALGEGSSEDAELARLELAALNSERFRLRFLQRNRPWIIAHVTELLTPRTLNDKGGDGKPRIDQVRALYAQLLDMRPGARVKEVSDEEADVRAEASRIAAWSQQPPP